MLCCYVCRSLKADKRASASLTVNETRNLLARYQLERVDDGRAFICTTATNALPDNGQLRCTFTTKTGLENMVKFEDTFGFFGQCCDDTYGISLEGTLSPFCVCGVLRSSQ